MIKTAKIFKKAQASASEGASLFQNSRFSISSPDVFSNEKRKTYKDKSSLVF
jgi:hypothetical protein